MKTLRFNEDFELDFLILGINSHIKLYKLCWEINKKLHTSFVKNKNHTINNNYITINNHYIETPSDQPYIDRLGLGQRKSSHISSSNQHHIYNFGPYK